MKLRYCVQGKAKQLNKEMKTLRPEEIETVQILGAFPMRLLG